MGVTQLEDADSTNETLRLQLEELNPLFWGLKV